MLKAEIFPKFESRVKARWAPVLLEPIAGSYERFVVGLAAINEDGFYVETANSMERLTCLYGDDAIGVMRAIRLANQYLEVDISRRSMEALTSPQPGITGISIGEIREGEGKSLQAIAQSWMAAISSLYAEAGTELNADTLNIALVAKSYSSADSLPLKVFEYVQHKRDRYVEYFNADLRSGKQRRRKGSSHEVIIDFSGSKLVANFGTLKAGSITSSVNLIKRRLWDLKVQRDHELDSILSRNHEMILQRPMANDPQVTDKQQTNLTEAFEALEEQADHEELRLRAMSSVNEIGEHILRVEAA